MNGIMSYLTASACIFLMVASAPAVAADPNVVWGSYLGGVYTDSATDVAVDAQGNVYVTGGTDSPGWVSGGYDPNYTGAGEDAFVVKLSPSGRQLWSTYVGGDSNDVATDIAVDAEGYVYVTGYTTSPGWVSGGFDVDFDGVTTLTDDAFVVKLSPEGAHVWSTYLGGAGQDIGEGIAVDSKGDVYVSGTTTTPDWLSGGYDASYNGGVSDAFVVKLTPDGQHIWSTYLGGALEESGVHIAVDANDGVYVMGQTQSPDWIMYGFNTTYSGGYDAFVARLSSEGRLLWSTYLGGQADDYAAGIAADRLGGVYAVGLTSSPGWVRAGADTELDGAPDGFLVKLTDSGGHVWSTYLGGADSDIASGVICDAADNVFVTGYIGVASDAVPSVWVSGGFDTTYNGGEYDGFVAAFTGAGRLLWSSFLGGSENDYGAGVAVDANDQVYVVGETMSSGWLRGGFDDTFNGQTDAFVVKITDGNAPPTSDRCAVYGFQSSINGSGFYTASESERQFLMDNFPQVWIYEGIAWYVPCDASDPNSMPVYRFWSDRNTAHFYTISEAERDMLVREHQFTWTLEGVAFYAYTETSHPAQTVPLYRLWSGDSGIHLYTIDEAEKDELIRDAADVWSFEGVAFYVYPP
jgi:hypothetical protein